MNDRVTQKSEEHSKDFWAFAAMKDKSGWPGKALSASFRNGRGLKSI